MIRIFSYISLIFNMCVAFSCPSMHEIQTDSFVYDYSKFSSIHLEQIDNYCLKVYFEREAYVDKNNNKEEFEFLAKKHNDDNYLGKISSLGHTPRYLSVSSVDFMSVSLFSKQKFNDDYIELQPLNNIVKILSTTTFPFIKSGYLRGVQWPELSEEWKKYMSYIREVYYEPFVQKTDFLYPIDKMLIELDEKDLTLIGQEAISLDQKKIGAEIPLCYLIFTKIPDIPGDYDITVEMVSDEKKIFSATTTMTFE